MVIYTDHLLRKVNLSRYPKSIISLCPSVTETLISLGLMDRISGRTRFCIHPKEKVQHIPRIGGTKSVHYDKIELLQPDLILAVKEENTQEIVENLSKYYPVFVIDINKVEDGVEMIRLLGQLTQVEEKAEALSQEILKSWDSLRNYKHSTSVLYMIWQNPFMLVGNDTYIDHVLTYCNFENLGRKFQGRYPTVDETSISSLEPDYLFLSSEPFPFRDKHVKTFQALLPNTKIKLVDGEMFSWYGSRMLAASFYIQQLVSGILR